MDLGQVILRAIVEKYRIEARKGGGLKRIIVHPLVHKLLVDTVRNNDLEVAGTPVEVEDISNLVYVEGTD